MGWVVDNGKLSVATVKVWREGEKTHPQTMTGKNSAQGLIDSHLWGYHKLIKLITCLTETVAVPDKNSNMSDDYIISKPTVAGKFCLLKIRNK